MRKRPQSFWLVSVLVLVLAGGAALWLMRARCGAAGGQFEWMTAACETSGRPIILQGDIHRV